MMHRKIIILLTKADAVGPSRIANSSFVKDMRGTIRVRIGKSNMIKTGKPIAAEKRKEKRVHKLCLSS
jgi:hypothetical protein